MLWNIIVKNETIYLKKILEMRSLFEKDIKKWRIGCKINLIFGLLREK